MKLVISLTDTNRYAGPVVHHRGASNASYEFLWSDRHNAHIYLGRELTPEEFNKFALDIFCGAETAFRPIPKAIEEKIKPAEEKPPTPPVEQPQEQPVVAEKPTPPRKLQRAAKPQEAELLT